MCLSNNCTVFLQVRKLKEKSVTYRLETQDHMIEYKCRTESKVKILRRGFIVILPPRPLPYDSTYPSPHLLPSALLTPSLFPSDTCP